MAGKTVIATIQCTMILVQHVLIQPVAITFKFLPYLKHVLEFHILWTVRRDIQCVRKVAVHL